MKRRSKRITILQQEWTPELRRAVTIGIFDAESALRHFHCSAAEFIILPGLIKNGETGNNRAPDVQCTSDEDGWQVHGPESLHFFAWQKIK